MVIGGRGAKFRITNLGAGIAFETLNIFNMRNMKKCKNLLFISILFSLTALHGQRNWEGVTLEYNPDLEASGALSSSIPQKSKFWMEFNHGVVRISNSNKAADEIKRGAYYYSGSYEITADTILVIIHDRKAVTRQHGGVNLSKIINEEFTPPEGEVAEQYKFVVREEGEDCFVFTSFNSFFVFKDNKGQYYTEEKKNMHASFRTVDTTYPWITKEEFLSKKRGRCEGVYRD